MLPAPEGGKPRLRSAKNNRENKRKAFKHHGEACILQQHLWANGTAWVFVMFVTSRTIKGQQVIC
jgi:hypothetical protein